MLGNAGSALGGDKKEEDKPRTSLFGGLGTPAPAGGAIGSTTNSTNLFGKKADEKKDEAADSKQIPLVSNTSPFGTNALGNSSSAFPAATTTLGSQPAFGSNPAPAAGSAFGAPTSTSTLGAPTPTAAPGPFA